MKSAAKLLVTVAFLCLLFASVAAASALPTLSIIILKDDGFGLGNDMNGVWTVNAVVSNNTDHVEFYLDNQLQRNVTQAPFSWTLDTATYSAGLHTIKVVAYDSSGESATATREPNFVGFPWGYIAGAILVGAVVLAITLVITYYRIKEAAAARRRL